MLTGRVSTERIRAEIQGLVSEGQALLGLFKGRKAPDSLSFADQYQPWYTQALPVVAVLLPDRAAEFQRQYERDAKRRGVSPSSYVIEDYIHSNMPDYWPDADRIAGVRTRLSTQVAILSSSISRLDSILANLRGVLQADLFDSELEAARHLEKAGHLRAAGAVAGVILEGHLSEVCALHGIQLTKRDPHISDFSEALKSAGVFDIANWRWMQRLADIRNLCDHKKSRDPTPDEVVELLDGVEKAIKTIR